MKMPTIRRTSGLRLVSLGMLILFVAALGCEGGCSCAGKGTIPDTPEARVADLGGHLPADTELTLVVSDLAKMRQTLETARDQLGDILPMADLIQEQVKNELGIDLLDAKSLKKSGLAADSAMAVGFFGQRPALLTYVADKQKFEKFITDQAKSSFGIEGMVKNKTVDGTKLKVLGSKPDNQLAWAYAGKTVVVGFPSMDEARSQAADKTPEDVKKLVSRLASMSEQKALASQTGYKRFIDALATKSAATLFINNNAAMTNERMDELKAQSESSHATAEWIKEHVDGIALGFDVEDSSARLRLWGGLPPKLVERLQAIQTPPTEAPIEHYATEHTLIGLRVSVDAAKFWKFYKEVLPEAQRKAMLSEFQQMADNANIDIEKDVITKLSGNLAALLYGVDKSQLGAGGRGALAALMRQPLRVLALIVPVQFQQKTNVDKVAKELLAAGQGAVVRRPVEADGGKEASGIEVLNVKNVKQSPGRLYLQDNLMTYATGVFSEQSVYEYMTGKRSEKQLAEVDQLDLGKEFATAKNYTGLYINFVRAKEHLGDLLAATAPSAIGILEPLEEAALTASVEQTGAFLTLTVDFVPQPKDSAGSKDDQGAESDKKTP